MTSTPLPTRPLGRSGLKITTVGFGAWAVGGGDWAFGWGPQDDDESLDAMRRAVALGVNWIDTAAVYGLGHSEELVGRAAAGSARRRAAARVHQVRHGLGRARPHGLAGADPRARLDPRASAKPRSGGSASSGSTCTSSTGPTRSAPRSRNRGQRWRG